MSRRNQQETAGLDRHPAKPRRILALAMMFACGAGACPGQTNGPALACDQPIHDFGEHNNTSDLDHVFLLRNEGTEPLVVARVRTGCGCSKTELSTNTIAPGANATLKARVCIKGFAGAKRSSIYVHSNDSSHPVFQLRVTGTAVSEIEIKPHTVLLQWRSGERPPEATVAVVNKFAAPFQITEVQSSSPSFSASVTTNSAGQSYTVAIHVATNQVTGSYYGAIKMATDHPRSRNLTIPVSAFIQSDLAVLPAQIVMTLGKDAETQSQTRYVVIRSPQAKEFRVVAVESSSPAVPANVQTAKPAWTRIRVGPFVPGPGLTNAAIIARTDVPGMERIVIPFRMAISAP
ncbi:MAG: DUF1573 domain-containing protein [Verrucomicrobiota bacterium]|nr:DUF1573 domain-containing protein [Verrucomicrobiota bacterium]